MNNTCAINDLKKYFEDMVTPTVNEYFEDIYNKRRAKLAALVLWHITDYSKKIKFEKGNRRIEYFKRVIRSIANATKHNILYETDKNKVFDSEKDIIEGNFINFSNMNFEHTNFGTPPYIKLVDFPKDITIKEIMNDVLEINIPIKEVYDFWQNIIY